MKEGTIGKAPTSMPGFDTLSWGGLPVGRTTLVAGTSGSAKTIFAAQFLAGGIADHGEPGVFVTFEETPADLRANMADFGWDIAAWEEEGKWAFVDASPDPHQEVIEIGDYDLGGLLARIGAAVERVGARRLAIDSLGAVFSQLQDASVVRRELFRIAHQARELGVTAVMTAERTEDYGPLARHGVEEFLCDNVVVLRNVLDDEQRRRTLEILKFRGTDHQKGEYPFVILGDRGIAVIPLTGIELRQRSSSTRITSGNAELDEMCGGGFFRDPVILVSGATGTGKTLTVTHFAAAAAGERCLLLGYEESREQLFRNAAGWGVDFEALEAAGVLKVHCEYPEMRGLEDHLLRMRRLIEEFGPQRVAVIEVEDRGCGIEPEMLEEIFEPFIQARSGARTAGGLGIGLTLVRQLVELHGGEVTAASAGPGTGSVFTVRLPAVSSAAAEPASERAAGAPERRGGHILVVDDNEDAAQALAEFLALSGFETATATTGGEGLALARAARPDAVLLDLDLPDLSGYQVAERLRADRPEDGLLIVAVSGFGHQQARERSRASGIDHHLLKPVDLEQLVALLGGLAGEGDGDRADS